MEQSAVPDRRLAGVDVSALKITDLIRLEQLQEIQDAFANATGVASIIIDREGHPITRPSNFTRLCLEVIRKTPRGLANCIRFETVLGGKQAGAPLMQLCPSGGLWDGGANIYVGDCHIASWLIGQVRSAELDESRILEYAREIGADEQAVLDAWKDVPVMGRDRFAQICETLFLIASQLSAQAYQNLALHQSESNLQTTLDSIGDAVIATDADGVVVRINPMAERLTGWESDDARGRLLSEVFPISEPEAGSEPIDPVDRVRAADQIINLSGHIILRCKDGTERSIADSAAPIHDPEGHLTGVVLVFRDVSSQRRLEEQLRQSQKMDAIGQLAGGVAHDFNNMLSGIMGAADLLSRRLDKDVASRQLVNLIIDATEKATSLTRKLLDFSRQGKIEPLPVDIHNVLNGSIALLTRSINRKIRIFSEFQAVKTIIMGDAAQLQNAILNLGINARDAMPEGGELRITTRNLTIGEHDNRLFEHEVAPGEFVEIDVSDTGIGIAPEYRKRLFEPFFTTKKPGKGTGLGLAAVYGMIKDHHGAIHVYSEVGRGTVFKLYLPILTQAAVVENAPPSPSASLQAGLRVLLVDDEAIVRNIGNMILEDMGCKVVTADDGVQGVAFFKKCPEDFDLVILDAIMPNLDGREAFLAIRELDPNVPVIFSSGFTDNQNLDELLRLPQVLGFIQKPYRVSVLREMVAQAAGRRKLR